MEIQKSTLKLNSTTFILKNLKGNFVSDIDFVKEKRLHMNLSHCHLSLETLFGKYACVDSKVTHRKDTNTVEHLQLRRVASQKVRRLLLRRLIRVTPGQEVFLPSLAMYASRGSKRTAWLF